MTAKSSAVAALRHTSGGFTLAELLVSVFVLTLIVFMAGQFMTSATAITRTGHKHIDTDTQARVVFDRMALDFAQMLKRTDIDYYVKQPLATRGTAMDTAGGRGTTETSAVTRSPFSARSRGITQPAQRVRFLW
jgi:type II secretory pathway component PulJ